MKKRLITRRDFLRATALSPVAGAFASNFKLLGVQSSRPKAKVVLIRDEDALVEFKKPNAKVVHRMLDTALSTLLEEKDPLQAWKQVIKPSDIVGIKSNVMNYLQTTSFLFHFFKTIIIIKSRSAKPTNCNPCPAI